jgi:hypothetical protein
MLLVRRKQTNGKKLTGGRNFERMVVVEKWAGGQNGGGKNVHLFCRSDPFHSAVLYHFVQFGSHASRTPSRTPKTFSKVQKSLKNAHFLGKNIKYFLL